MGSSAKHCMPTNSRLRTILIASPAAVAMAAAWAVIPSGGHAGSTAAETRSAGHERARGVPDSVRTPRSDPGAALSAWPAPTPVRKATGPRQRARTGHGVKVLSSGVCRASFYGDAQSTASGERFDPQALTAAHRTLPMNSRVRVTNKATDRTVTVRINDRGPYVGGRCLDLSAAAMKAIGGVGSGVITAGYEVIARA